MIRYVKQFIIFALISTNMSCASRKGVSGKPEIVVYIHLTPEYLQFVNVDRDAFFIGPRPLRQYYVTKLSKVPDLPFERNLCFDTSSIPKISYANVEACLTKFMQTNNIKRIVMGPGENNVMMGGHFRTKFGIPGMQENEAKAFVDKSYMKEILLKNDPNIPTAKQLILTKQNVGDSPEKLKKLIHDKFGDQEKKFILKPTSEASSQGVELFDNIDKLFEELASHLESVKDSFEHTNYVLENFIEGDVYRLDGYVSDGNVLVNYTAKSLVLPRVFYHEGALSADTLVTDKNQVDKYDAFASRIIKALEYKEGVFHLEAFQKNDGSIVFLEIAARPGGSLNQVLPLLGYDPREAYIFSQVGKKVTAAKNNKIFDVLELFAPKEISDSKQQHRIIKVYIPVNGLETFQKDISYIPKSFTSILPSTKQLANIAFVADAKDKEKLDKEVASVYNRLEFEMLILGGENYYHVYSIKDGRWSHKPWQAPNDEKKTINSAFGPENPQ